MKNITKLTIGLVTVSLISFAKVVLANPKWQNPITHGATNISQVSTPEDNTFSDFEVEVERSQPAAQQTSTTLEEAWPHGGFASYQWLRLQQAWPDNDFATYEWRPSYQNRDVLYSSSVYIEVVGNTLKIYKANLSEPLGQRSRCGGLGCDLAKGSLVATLNLEHRRTLEIDPNRQPFPLIVNLFVVGETSERASFLQGAQCRTVYHMLECVSTQIPPISTTNLPSFYRFTLGD